jgi:hemolysin-activating ACP:hemolysin acyltransferase
MSAPQVKPLKFKVGDAVYDRNWHSPIGHIIKITKKYIYVRFSQVRLTRKYSETTIYCLRKLNDLS